MAESGQASNASCESWSSSTNDDAPHLVGSGRLYPLCNVSETLDNLRRALFSTTSSPRSSYLRETTGKTASTDCAARRLHRLHGANPTKAAIQERSAGWFFYIQCTLQTSHHQITTFSGLSPTICVKSNSILNLFRRVPRFRLGIEKLPERWEAVVNNAGEYIADKL